MTFLHSLFERISSRRAMGSSVGGKCESKMDFYSAERDERTKSLFWAIIEAKFVIPCRFETT